MIKTDFIVVGSGISGMYLAIQLSKYGKVLVVTKKKVFDSNSYNAQGGIAGVIDRYDSVGDHIKDTLKAGCYHNNTDAVNYLAKNAYKIINVLKKYGVKFSELSTKEGGHSYNRVHHTFDRTGKSITESLYEELKTKSNISILENTPVSDLVYNREEVFGVYAVLNKDIVEINSKVVVLSTGGLGQLFSITSNPRVATGDGISIAKNANIKLRDLEFIQIHPTALNMKNNPYLLLSETLRGEGAVLVDDKLNKIMEGIHILGDLAPRDIVTREVFKHKTYLDFRHKDKQFLSERFPFIYESLMRYGIDLSKDLVPITPAVHYSCGGIAVDLCGRTSLNNLYAVGEVACTGVHGANRLASNSLMECMVFTDRIVSEIINTYQNPKTNINKPLKLPFYSSNLNLINRIRDIMWDNVSVLRTKKGLEYSYDFLSAIKDTDSYELRNYITTSKEIVKSALKRGNSLGCHYIIT